MQPTKVIGSLVNSDLQALSPTSSPTPPGTVVDVPSYQISGSGAALEADYTAMATTSGATPTLLNQFMSTFNENSNPLPGNLTSFVTDYVNFLVGQGAIPSSPPTAASDAVTTILNGFVSAFETATSFNSSSASATAVQSLFPNLVTDGFGNSEDPQQLAMTNAAFQTFISDYPYQSNGAVAPSSTPSAQGFFQNFRQFTVVTATLDGTAVFVNNSSGSPVNATSSLTPSFEETFTQYFPTMSPTDPLYSASLATFAANMIGQVGYFSPSQQYTQWVSFVQNLAGVKAPAVATLPQTSVAILNEIYSLLSNMITAIQNVAASQAQRLQLYTSWQKAYTDLLNQVPTFTASSNDRLADNRSHQFSDTPGNTKLDSTRQDIQGNFNAGVTQQITAYNNTVSEDAKNLQSSLNQTTDASNNQMNIGASLLQLVSTVLSSIFR